MIIVDEKIDNWFVNQRHGERYSIITQVKNLPKSEATRKNSTTIQQCYPKLSLKDNFRFN